MTRFGSDFWTGVLFVLIGTIGVIAAQQHPLGTAMRMGPAFFPTMLGGILIVLGAVLAGGAIARGDTPIGSWPLRPLLLIPLAILAFALLLQPVGLVSSTVALVVISAFGGWEFRLREVLLLSLALAALVVAIFVVGLGLPFRLWPRF